MDVRPDKSDQPTTEGSCHGCTRCQSRQSPLVASHSEGAVTISNTGAKHTTVDVTIAGGVVTVPAAGAINVSGAGISSAHMNVQLYSSAGALVTHDSAVWQITGMGAAPGQCTIANTSLADGTYVLSIVGNLL